MFKQKLHNEHLNCKLQPVQNPILVPSYLVLHFLHPRTIKQFLLNIFFTIVEFENLINLADSK